MRILLPGMNVFIEDLLIPFLHDKDPVEKEDNSAINGQRVHHCT